jgi:hypothetical protein
VNLSDRQEQFTNLLAECSQTFLTGERGEEQRLAYLAARLSAQHNYAAVRQLDAQGIEITDAVLLRLLPYTDTEQHRTQGAWLHPDAFITGDLRRWYEASGMTPPDAWPTIARALWTFIQQCMAEDADLEEACRQFAAEPATKGFQTGLVTPILNALQPERYLLLNRKGRTTLNHFANTSFGHTMLDYPAANAALQRFLDDQPRLQQLAAALEMLPGDLFDLFSEWLVSERNFAFHPTTYWRITLDDDPSLWLEWQEGGYVAMGWDEMGDVGEIGQNEFHARRDSLLHQYPQWRKSDLNQLWRFAHQLHEGDKILVTAPHNRILGYGTLVAPYYFVSEVGLGHRRPIEWEDVTPREAELPEARGLVRMQSTLFHAATDAPAIALDEHDGNEGNGGNGKSSGNGNGANNEVRYIAPNPLHLPARESTALYATRAPIQPVYTLEECADATGLSTQTLGAWVHAIERKGQAILYGPPGTGKTFVAHHLARHLISGGDGFTQLLQFHPAYSYEEFIQGLRPQAEGNGLAFTMQPGRFLHFCREAAGRMGVCVLIIDEINRANLPQVLGELLYLLEYREAQIKLAGSDTPFSIPANVRILGTMNTADRSIALVDNALRRRFAFLRITPDLNVLRHYHNRIGTPYRLEPLIALLQEINRAIGDPNFALGISYFLHDDLASELPSIWQVEIEPYLEEFFFDQPEQIAPFRWGAVKTRLGF